MHFFRMWSTVSKFSHGLLLFCLSHENVNNLNSLKLFGVSLSLSKLQMARATISDHIFWRINRMKTPAPEKKPNSDAGSGTHFVSWWQPSTQTCSRQLFLLLLVRHESTASRVEVSGNQQLAWRMAGKPRVSLAASWSVDVAGVRNLVSCLG